MRVLSAILLLCGAIAFAPTVSSAQPGWFWQNPLPQGNHLWGVATLNKQTVIAVGESGTVLRSGDAGESWTLPSSGTTNRLYAVSFGDGNTGVAVGELGTILRTSDGGESWASQLSGTT